MATSLLLDLLLHTMWCSIGIASLSLSHFFRLALCPSLHSVFLWFSITFYVFPLAFLYFSLMRTKLFTFPITLRTLNHISGLLLRLQATFGYQVENFPFVYFIFCVLFLFFVFLFLLLGFVLNEF